MRVPAKSVCSHILVLFLVWINCTVAAETVDDLLDASDNKKAVATGEKPLRTGVARSNEPSTGYVPDSKPNLSAQVRLDKVKSMLAQRVPRTESTAHLSRLVAEFPEYNEARLLLGREEIAAGSTQTALTTLAPLLQPTNPDWQPWFWVGTAYLAQNDLDQAKQHFEIATAKDSRVCALWVQLAVLSQELGEHSSALQYLHIAEQIDSNYGQLHFNRAYSLEQLGRQKEARQAYQRFLISEVEPSSQPLRVTAMQRIDTLSQGLEIVSAARLAAKEKSTNGRSH